MCARLPRYWRTLSRKSDFLKAARRFLIAIRLHTFGGRSPVIHYALRLYLHSWRATCVLHGIAHNGAQRKLAP